MNHERGQNIRLLKKIKSEASYKTPIFIKNLEKNNDPEMLTAKRCIIFYLFLGQELTLYID